MLLTYRYRIKDSSSRKTLCVLAGAVNFVWNYVNELNKKNFSNFKQGGKGRFLSAFDINNLLAGTSKELGLHSQSIQHIGETYVKSRKQAKKPWLAWRNRKRSLGWIPFKSSGLECVGDTVRYQDRTYRIWQDRQLPADAKIKCGSFCQDSQDRWYVNITFDIAARAQHEHPDTFVGIDLGVKEMMTLSDGTSFHRAGATKNYEAKLAAAQRARKKRQISKIQAKIKNSRKDHCHKITTQIDRQFATIFVGDVSSQNIIDKGMTNLTKGVYDASWFFVNNLLEYKAFRLGGLHLKVNEAYSTQDCSSCGARCGPAGEEELNVREWTCSKCGETHLRDHNGAKNILRIGHNTLASSRSDDAGSLRL